MARSRVCGRANAAPPRANRPCSVRMPGLTSSAVAEKSKLASPALTLRAWRASAALSLAEVGDIALPAQECSPNDTYPAQRRRQEYRRMCFLPSHRDLPAAAIASVLTCW
jgi:hypothetical protein